MHYKNGREAKVGDTVFARSYDGTPFTAVVVKATPGATTCNLTAVPLPATNTVSLTAGECYHADDMQTPQPAGAGAPAS